MNFKETLVADLAKASPPGVVTGLHFYGISLSDIVMLLTAVYTVAMLYFLFRDKWWRQRDTKD